ncbi:MAG: 16S rRNA (adenine(1518)-N(6)/adenine(1519)-N(6))-dimethyltransferase RsmA [Rhodospirillaceae bacterium]|nr:16S rRNA (adenine(1518)-N(6)/adenine(1519)-N(6))-dimethyltransferase RsmA [Rhodospirillaceae bacterium]
MPPTDAAVGAGLPPLRDVIRSFGLSARKGLGQHFLLDLNLTRRIARAAGDLTDVAVIEVGPGPGGLTRALLESSARRVIAIERDDRCIAALQPLVAAGGGRLTVLAEDALAVDMAALDSGPMAVVANLPYNIATPLLLGWLAGAGRFRSLTLMFQREVADRLVAVPGTKAYGRLSVVTQWRTRASRLFHVPPSAFTPPPAVQSTVVQLMPLADPADVDWSTVERVTQAAFGQRRKMLRHSLRSLGDAEALLAAAALSGTDRAEDVPIDGFIALARGLEAAEAPLQDAP